MLCHIVHYYEKAISGSNKGYEVPPSNPMYPPSKVAEVWGRGVVSRRVGWQDGEFTEGGGRMQIKFVKFCRCNLQVLTISLKSDWCKCFL